MSDSLWLNDAGAILGDTTGTFKPYYDDHCCCCADQPAAFCSINERLKLTGWDELDPCPAYTLEELVTEANRFIAFRYWTSGLWGGWSMDTSFGDGSTSIPSVIDQTSTYFSTTDNTKPGYVTDFAELYTAVSAFTTVFRQSQPLSGYYTGQGNGTTSAAAIAAATSAWTFVSAIGFETSTRLFKFSSTSFRANALAFVPSCSNGSSPRTSPRSLALYVIGETAPDDFNVSTSFYAHGQGVSNGSYRLVASGIKAANDDDELTGDTWDGSPSVPSSWPSDPATYQGNKKGWVRTTGDTNDILKITYSLIC